MATTVIPTLSVTKGFLTNDSDKAAYLLTFWLYNPGGASDYYESFNGSLRMLAYEFQQYPQQLADVAKIQLERIFTQNFPNTQLSIDVSVKEVDGYRYGLVINIMSAPTNSDDYKPIILSRSLLIDNDYRIILKPLP